MTTKFYLGNALCRFCQHLPLCYDLIEGQKRKGQASSWLKKD